MKEHHQKPSQLMCMYLVSIIWLKEKPCGCRRTTKGYSMIVTLKRGIATCNIIIAWDLVWEGYACYSKLTPTWTFYKLNMKNMFFHSDIPCIRGDVRLVGGETGYEGRVEICLNDFWVSVCDSSWNVVDSTVVCRQLTGIQNPCTK